MRTTFINTLIQIARKDPSVFLITGDLGFSVLEPYIEEFPDRFLNIGIAEQNMTGVAAGLSMEGYTVFTYSIGNFPTLRCMEQIRYDICYHNLNVKIVAVGSGYAYGPLGVSHHTTEDIGMLRTIPNLTLCSPSDPKEVSALTKYMVDQNGPCYLRLNKTGEPSIHTNEPVIDGSPIKVLSGRGKLILGTGVILQDFYERAKKEGWALWSFPVLSSLKFNWSKFNLEDFEEIITVEEHQRNAGFGSLILESLSDNFYEKKITVFPKVRRLAIPNRFLGISGTQDFLKKEAGLYL